MISNHEHKKSTDDTSDELVTSQMPVQRHVQSSSSSNNSEEEEEIVILKSSKIKPPIDYLIWSSMLVISGVLICGFVVSILLIVAYENMFTHTKNK